MMKVNFIILVDTSCYDVCDNHWTAWDRCWPASHWLISISVCSKYLTMYLLSSFIIHSARNPLFKVKHFWWLLPWTIPNGFNVSHTWCRFQSWSTFQRLICSRGRNSKSYNATKQHKSMQDKGDVNSIPFKIFVKRKNPPRLQVHSSIKTSPISSHSHKS